MRNIGFFRKMGVVILSFLLAAVLWLITITRANKNLSNPNPVTHFAVENHFFILVILVVISAAYGFLWSSISYHEIQQKRKDSKSILETVFLFLGQEERNIIEFMVQHKGETTQAEISRLPGMTRVKAFRSLQKMADKNLIEIVPHGKVRKVSLTANIRSVLLEY